MDAKRKREQVTMKDVAKATGFSPATVSIVLNNAPLARYIAPGTRQKIEESAKRMGYRPNAMARFLRSKRSQSIGVMMFDVTDPFCTPILRGVENALYPLGYLPILADAHNQRERFERYLEMLLERHVDGLIVVANWLFVDIHVLADLNKAEVPTVTIGWEIPGNRVSFAMVDNEAGGRLAIEHLYQLGHRRIAMIRGPKRLIDSAPRWRGIQKFAQSVRQEIDPSLVLQLPDVFDANASFEQGYRLTEELLQKKKKFTALLAFDDLTALGAIRPGQGRSERTRAVLRDWLRRRGHLRALGAVTHDRASATGNHGWRGGEHGDGSNQGRPGKSRMERGGSPASSGTGDSRLDTVNLSAVRRLRSKKRREMRSRRCPH